MGNFPIGTLDRTGSVYSVATTQGAGGAPVNVLTKLGSMYFRQETVNARTVLQSGRDAVDIEDTFICRWLPGLGPGYQINVEGSQYRIVKAQELGRREGWRIWCRSVQ